MRQLIINSIITQLRSLILNSFSYYVKLLDKIRFN